jgi:hypothetical protein
MLGPMYCPNCNSTLEPNTAACAGCGADFGVNSSWKPLSVPPPTPEPQPPALSKRQHILQSFALFVIAGPPLGGLAAGGGIGALIPPFNIVSYILGGPPAAIAGVFFACISLLALHTSPRLVIGRLPGLVIGFVAGTAGILTWHGLLLGLGYERRADYSGDFIYMLHAAMLSGCACGFLSGWLLPVGKECFDNQVHTDRG